MKNLYITTLSLVMATGLFAQWGQINNGGFENWTNVSLYDTPTDWMSSNSQEFYGIPTVLKSTDAQLGTYSAELKSVVVGQDTVFGYVFQGQFGASGPEGGIPYTAMFNNIRLRFKSDLAVGDSLFVLAIRFMSGFPIEMINMAVPGANGINSSWTTANVPMSTTAQEELFLGFVLNDPFGDQRPDPASWTRIDNVELTNAGIAMTAIPNFSFENWDNISVEEPNYWYTFNSTLAGESNENVKKTNDKNSGTYAVELTTVTNQFDDTIQGFLSMGMIDINNWMNPFGAVPYNAVPTTFSGAYKYAPSNGDAASINISFMSGGSLIGFHNESFNAPQATYATFSSPLALFGTPDSVIVVANSGENSGSILKLDDLSFSGGDVSINELTFNDFSVYPNPAQSEVFIGISNDEFFNIQIVDMYGNVVFNQQNITGIQQIKTNTYASGAYLVKITSGSKQVTQKLLVN